LDTAGNPNYLGEHAVKFLVTGRYLPRAHKMLAIAQDIQVIELPGYMDVRCLPQQEETRLVDMVKRSLGGRGDDALNLGLGQAALVESLAFFA
jgi:hypothetical protein